MRPTKFDVIIVGSGLGGLVSAVVMAKQGYRVCILEKNNQFGGNLQTFSRNKKIFDTGVHYLGGLDRGQNLFQYFSYLGIMSSLKLERMPTVFDQILFDGDENRYPIAQGYDNFVNELLAYFPDEGDALRKYVTDLQETCRAFPLYNFEDKQTYPPYVLDLSVKRYFDSLTTNEKLKSVLVGANFLYAGEELTTPFYVHALSINSYILSAFRCVNGGSQISKLLIRELKKHGGKAYKHQEVIKYHVTEGKISHVETAAGDRYAADLFISNTDPKLTLRQIGQRHFRKVYFERILSLPVSISSFSVHLVLIEKKISYRSSNLFYHRDLNSVWSAAGYSTANWPAMYMLSMTEDKQNVGYADTITALTYMRFDEVREWNDTFNTVTKIGFRGASYESFKQQKLNQMIAQIEKEIPHLSTTIKASYTSTPLSYRDYIGSFEGSLYGPLKDYNDPLRYMISPKSKIPNLYFTGQGVNMHGILGVTIGGVATCAEILGHNYLIHHMRQSLSSDDLTFSDTQ
ncbi:NAD(P)/FAD-dependent oxidoreductase [Sphingobacterium alkalisoli]|uniref:NAD(P)/FAD-dependent oxidoreductase n=1 Tax=Sphingobacterium alkalisoli TaxID=1874115 RepID=A0A4U0H8V4_9SPHI|nr:NAD(P)/FAD-dependent oxidoreductase [Sphingobacterium alkalisoli]TJY68270.1 NAD(P)/FAD-dependent oxidoreductase [Sphingobacterium alkalisoli]GGH07692.1 all-trans-retinol 13,14-reductase [Sphingobacterium alkalisoli]